MSNGLAAKIKNTQSSFPAQQPGSVTECPFKKKVTEAPTPVEVETAFQMTQQILQSMSPSRPVEKPKEKKAWIEIILVDNEGKPMPGVKYRITPPGGAPTEGRLNEHGQAGLYEIEPGSCKITFPGLDKETWET